MNLSELSPQWITRDGQKVGFVFLCPCCKDTKIFCTVVGLTISEQCKLLAEQIPHNRGDIIPSKQNNPWQWNGADFDKITIMPSIDASAAKHWHGFITDGIVK